MSKGIPGLLYLSQLDITNSSGLTCSVRAYRDVLAKVERLQVDQVQDITLTSEQLPSSQPYFNSTWTITSTGGVAATASVELSTVSIGDTLTFNGQIYTAASANDADTGEFNVTNITDIADATDLVLVIEGDTREGNQVITASNSLGFSATVDLLWDTTGVFANSSTLETTDATSFLLSGSTFTGGLDPDTYTLLFISETNLEVGSIPPIGLTTKRPLDIAFTGASNPFTVRSLISVINWIQRTSEVKVSSGGLGVQATGTVTLVSVVASQIVTINGLVYTAVVGTKADNTEFNIQDIDDTVDAADLADSVLNDTRTGTLADVTATSALNVVTLSSTAVGAVGNFVELNSSNGVTLAVSGGLFTGGSDAADLAEGVADNVILKGATPYLTYTWGIVKLGDIYTLTSTADS